MPRTPSAAFDWAYAEAQAGRVHSNWAGLCEALINWMYDFTPYPTALAAGSASGPLRTDYANAPAGAQIYWSGVYVEGVECGHIATVHTQDADPLIVCATTASAGINWGRNIRVIRLSAYQATFGHPLRGWSLRHGVQTADFGGPAGGNAIPIIQEDAMGDFDRVRRTTDGSIMFADIYAVEPNVLAFKDEGVGVGEYLNALGILSPVQTEVDNRQYDIVNMAVRNRSRWYVNFIANTVASIVKASMGTAQVDTAALAKQITDGVLAGLPEGADAQAVAEAVESALADNFAAVNANIDDQPTTFEITPKKE